MANQKLSAIISIGAAMQPTVGKTFGKIDKGLEGIGKEIGVVIRRQRELEKQRTVLEKQGRAVDELDREYQGLGRTLDQLRAKEARLKLLSDRAGQVGSSFSKMGRTIAWQAGLASAAVGSLYTGMVSLGIRVAGDAEEMTRFARRLGVTTEFLSNTDYAARRFGVGIEDLVDGMKELSLRADEFAVTGKGPAAEAFARIGISQKQAGALAKDTAALWTEVQRRMANVTDDAARQRIADELFGGTGGEKLIEYLKLSREEIAAMEEEAKKVGYTITGDLSEAARRFTREQERLQAAVTGTFRTIGAEVLPTVGEQFEKLNNWLIDNQDKVQAFGKSVGETFERIAPRVEEVATGIGKVITKVGDLTAKFADVVGGWENLGIVVGVAFMTPTLIAIGKVVFAIGGLLASIAKIGPAFAAAGAAAGGAGGIGAALGAAAKIGLRAGPLAAAGLMLTPSATNTGPNGETESDRLNRIIKNMNQNPGAYGGYNITMGDINVTAPQGMNEQDLARKIWEEFRKGSSGGLWDRAR